MLAKARKSSFNANIGEFCSVTFVCLFVYGALNYLDIFRIQVYAIKCRLIEQIFGVHGVQETFLRLSAFV